MQFYRLETMTFHFRCTCGLLSRWYHCCHWRRNKLPCKHMFLMFHHIAIKDVEFDCEPECNSIDWKRWHFTSDARVAFWVVDIIAATGVETSCHVSICCIVFHHIAIKDVEFDCEPECNSIDWKRWHFTSDARVAFWVVDIIAATGVETSCHVSICCIVFHHIAIKDVEFDCEPECNSIDWKRWHITSVEFEILKKSPVKRLLLDKLRYLRIKFTNVSLCRCPIRYGHWRPWFSTKPYLL